MIYFTFTLLFYQWSIYSVKYTAQQPTKLSATMTFVMSLTYAGGYP